MSGNYIPLYRKYRPQTLETLVGQEHIKKTLTSAIELGKISHAYLFTGPRGTGKTSTARILAKSLNCTNGPTTKPCGECASCKDITNSIPIDVIEIDAASNRKVEDAQSILEKVQYVPVNGKFKIDFERLVLTCIRIYFIYQKVAKLVEQIKIATFICEHCYLLFTIKKKGE